jgi:gliding motility-associated-like protein
MKHKIFLTFFILLTLISKNINAQPIQVFNTAGDSKKISGGNYYAYNIGEPIIGTGGHYYTQGFLQPNYKSSTILNVSAFTTAMSCQNSNDASIILNVNGVNSPYTYKWYKNGTLLSDKTNSLLNIAQGTYSYSVSDSIGNLRTGNFVVNNGTGECKIVIYNGISPNNDGYNDFFNIKYIENFPNNEVSVYNRWGNLVWNGKNYDNQSVVWKGEDASGTVLVAGTYFYIVVIDGSKTIGWVELIR